MTRIVRGSLAAMLVCLAASGAAAQESKSAPLAKQLAAALDAAKLDAVAAKDPAAPDLFVAALYFPGSEILVVSAKYSAPSLLVDKLAKKQYRDVYIDLNSASVPASRVLIEDSGADGLRAKRDENQPIDVYEENGKRTMFDSDWKKQKLSEQEYMKTFSTADDRYAQILTMLIAQLKQPS